MAGRAKRGRTRRQSRRPGILARAARRVRQLFSGGTSLGYDPRLDPPVGGVGVREPRRPVRPTSSGAVALEPPPAETRDVWAVGDEDRD